MPTCLWDQRVLVDIDMVPTRPGNPLQLVRNQHTHSAAALRRFAEDDRVRVFSKRGSDFLKKPTSSYFCAKRVWDQRVERGLFKTVEDRFQAAVGEMLEAGRVHDQHQPAIADYIAVWRARTELAAGSWVADARLPSLTSTALTAEQEELLESRWVAHIQKHNVPRRFLAGLSALPLFDQARAGLSRFSWVLLRTSGDAQFVCPDNPGARPFMAITPQAALVVGCPEGTISDRGVAEANRESWAQARSWVIAHPSFGAHPGHPEE